MEIYERLYQFRTKVLDLKKNEMAEKLGMSPSNYGKCEDGTIQLNFETMKKLSDLGMDLHWLITGKSPPQSSTAPPGEPNKPESFDLAVCKALLEEKDKKYEALMKLLSETIATGRAAHGEFHKQNIKEEQSKAG